MRWLGAVLLAVLSVAWAQGALADSIQARVVRVTLGREGDGRDWSGRAGASPGRVVRLQGWRLQEGDRLGDGWAWTCGASTGGPRALLITLEAPTDAALDVSTRSGDARFALRSLAGGEVATALEGAITAQLLPAPASVSGAEEADFPALAAAADGRIWSAWVGFNGQNDRIHFSEQVAGAWENRGVLPRTRGPIHRVALAALPDSRLLAVWSEDRGGNWDLFSAVGDGKRWSKPARITSNPASDFSHRLAVSSSGSVWLVWQAFEGKYSHIRLASWVKERWSEPTLVTEAPTNHWAPSLAVSASGEVHVAWDSYAAGNYDVYLRSLREGRLTPVRRVTDSSEYEANASLACEPGGRLWIAYDAGEAEWGKGAGARDLHRERRLGLRCLDGDRLMDPPSPRPEALAGAAPFAEAPRVAVDGKGGIWLAYRRSLRPGGWDLVAQRFDGRAWTAPLPLAPSIGRSDMDAAFAVPGEGAPWIAWATDGRDGGVLHHAVFAAALPGGSTSADPAAFPEAPAPQAPGAVAWQERERPSAIFAREAYQLHGGDLHRHTELSVCHPFAHGSLLDAYRYALDAAHLSFMATTDPLPDEALGGRCRWRLARKMAGLFTQDGVFVALPGTEAPAPAGGFGALLCSSPGHRPDPLAGADQRALWEGKDPDVLPAIYAGAGSPGESASGTGSAVLAAPFEGGEGCPVGAESAQSALKALLVPRAAGARAAWIAGTGHDTANRRTWIWAGYLTRDAVVTALRARWSYVGPDGVDVRFTVQGKLAGSSIRVGGRDDVELRARVMADQPVRRLDVLRDGTVIASLEPAGEGAAELSFTDPAPSPGDHAYCLRVTTADGQEAWTTPAWVSVQ